MRANGYESCGIAADTLMQGNAKVQRVVAILRGHQFMERYQAEINARDERMKESKRLGFVTACFLMYSCYHVGSYGGDSSLHESILCCATCMLRDTHAISKCWQCNGHPPYTTSLMTM